MEKNSGNLTFTTPTDREIMITRVFDAPRKRLFEAYTNPKHLSQWLLGPPGWTMPICEADVRPGGAWHFVWRKADGQEMAMRGVYKDVKAPERIVNTESWGGDYPETTNTVTFAQDDDKGKTTVTTTILYPTKAARDAALKTGMKDGVAVSYNRLAEHLAGMKSQ
jgi:uncharacterized protein YndB with AHSA1/START domain